MEISNAIEIPTYDELMNRVLRALSQLGGSGTNAEIAEQVAIDEDYSSEVLDEMHGDSGQTEIEYRLAWEHTYLKKYGLLENSKRGVWALTAKGKETERVDPADVVPFVRDEWHKKQQQSLSAADPGIDTPSDEAEWTEEVLDALKDMDPTAFERLCQRLLRESGFTEVTVTKRGGDGGIDGHGLIRIGGLISFPVMFQSKRYQGTVGASIVRDFRGAMVGRAEKGVLMTTGTFTRDARSEATRDGAPPVDLVDGEALAQKLKELELGVSTELKEVVTIDRSWFQEL